MWERLEKRRRVWSVSLGVGGGLSIPVALGSLVPKFHPTTGVRVVSGSSSVPSYRGSRGTGTDHYHHKDLPFASLRMS